MDSSYNSRLSLLFLRYAPSFARLRRLPVLGPCLGWISARLIPRESLTWIQVQDGPAAGLWFRIHVRTGHCTLEGNWEPAVQQALVQHLRPGMTFYDLGANIGSFSLLAARLVGPGGRVFAFEADPEIAARLRENIAHNKFTHVSVEEKAVWSEPTTVSFVRADSAASPDRGLGHVSAGDTAATNTISVEAVSLDEFVLLHPAPDFLKCDVEGAEVAVLQGAERLLREKRPILLVEMHSSENRLALTRKFSQLGYACSNLDENHVLALPQ